MDRLLNRTCYVSDEITVERRIKVGFHLDERKRRNELTGRGATHLRFAATVGMTSTATTRSGSEPVRGAINRSEAENFAEESDDQIQRIAAAALLPAAGHPRAATTAAAAAAAALTTGAARLAALRRRLARLPGLTGLAGLAGLTALLPGRTSTPTLAARHPTILEARHTLLLATNHSIVPRLSHAPGLRAL